MNIKQAEQVVGSLSNPSKMPTFSWSTPANKCKIGSFLRKVKGSTCAACYAADTYEHYTQRREATGKHYATRYLMPNVQEALERRYRSIDNPRWVKTMAWLIDRRVKYDPHIDQQTDGQYKRIFRWHDSGDIRDMAHFVKIVKVCELTDDILHWLPTRESGVIKEYKSLGGHIPPNLNIRLSATMVDDTSVVTIEGTTTSTVESAPKNPDDTCPAYQQGGKCLTCRKCWLAKVPNVVYVLH